jgi:hypothetical protein
LSQPVTSIQVEYLQAHLAALSFKCSRPVLGCTLLTVTNSSILGYARVFVTVSPFR